jgi:quercetin dioxygenase-like cupin family protein
MDTQNLREKLNRDERLDEDWLHLFSLDSMIVGLRSEDEYSTTGHTGLTLLKTSTLRIVLEVAKEGSRIAEHSVHGPTVIHVLEGSIRIQALDETRVAHHGEMVVVPNDLPREIEAEKESAFLWILALDGDE